MKKLVIGDIHGCYFEFQELLSKSGISDQDAIIALGDTVDRGPETPQVLDFFRQQPNARSLMGNHERKHVLGAKGQVKLALSQVISREQIGETYGDALLFMSTLPNWIELPEAILVHGYLEAGVPLEEQLATVLCGTMSGDRYLHSRYNRPWYELYDSQKPVIVGHLDYRKDGHVFVYHERIFGLDTSCVHGKTLTGLILPDFTIVSVPSRGNHWSMMKLNYRRSKAATQPIKAKAISARSTAWDEGSEKILQEILDLVAKQNEQILAHLRNQPNYENLTPRQQANAYAAEIGETPLRVLLHMARKEQLDLVRARKVVKSQTQVLEIAKQVGLR
jgi:serine/threonine protein phosphatase 1